MHARITMSIVLICLVLLLNAPAYAQDHTRNWENGAVVVVTEVHTKDGMFNAYINDLNNVWRKFLEVQMEDGNVLDYGMYVNASAREDEPDLFLTVTYANWAAFDLGNEYFDKVREKVIGTEDQMRQANLDRSELRTIGGTMTLQEIKFAE